MKNDSLNGSEIDRIIHFLEYEISSRRSEEKRHGWTTWAIFGAIAYLLWLLFSDLDTSASISWRNVLYITLLLSVSFDVLYLFNATYSTFGFNQLKSYKRFKIYYPNIKNNLVLLFRAGLLIVLYNWVSPILNGLVYLCWAYFLFNFIFLLFPIVTSSLKVPIPTNQNIEDNKIASAVNKINQTLYFGSGTITILGLVSVIHFKFIEILVCEWRLGFIIFSLLLLICILCFTRSDPVLLLELDETRRRLSLGKIDLETAKKQIDLLI